MERTLLRLNRDDLHLLRGKMQLGRVTAGRLLVKEGVPPLGLFIVRSGCVLVQRNLIGHASTVATLGAGEMFGEMAFISPAPHPATASVVAGEDTEVIVLTPQRLHPLFEQNAGLCARFYHSIALALSRRLRAFNLQAGGPRGDRYGDLPAWEIL